MATTYGEMRQRIQDYCEYAEESFVRNIPVFIQNAEERIFYNVQLPVFKEEDRGSLTRGNSLISIPLDFKAPISLFVSNAAGDSTFLLNKDSNFLREIYPQLGFSSPPDARSLGTPRFYGLDDNSFILVAPAPEETVIYRLRYAATSRTLVDADNDNNATWLSVNASDALFYGAVSEAYIYMKGEDDLIAKTEERFVAAIHALQNLGETRDRKDVYRSGEKRSNEAISPR